MSIEAISEFRETVRGNAELETAIKGLLSDQGVLDAAGLAELGNRHGYAFTEAEVMSFDLGSDDELSDFELEMVSAGIGMTCVNNKV
jgi:predicted ribosomally synthesized peptide with nif11-like leader